MSMSLRDQLIQAGLGSKKQAKQATPPPKKAPSRHQPPSITPEKLAAMKAQAAKSARDQELNRKQQEKAAAKARRAEVKQLIEQHRLPPVVSEEYFNFADGSRSCGARGTTLWFLRQPSQRYVSVTSTRSWRRRALLLLPVRPRALKR